jgi:hypothetical protein
MTLTRALAACLLIAATPLAAEEPAETPNPDFAEGSGLMQEGARLLLRGFMTEMGPTIVQMEQLVQLLGDFDKFYPPEVQPNGDIIIRRRIPLNPGLPGDETPEGDIDL